MKRRWEKRREGFPAWVDVKECHSETWYGEATGGIKKGDLQSTGFDQDRQGGNKKEPAARRYEADVGRNYNYNLFQEKGRVDIMTEDAAIWSREEEGGSEGPERGVKEDREVFKD